MACKISYTSSLFIYHYHEAIWPFLRSGADWLKKSEHRIATENASTGSLLVGLLLLNAIRRILKLVQIPNLTRYFPFSMISLLGTGIITLILHQVIISIPNLRINHLLWCISVYHYLDSSDCTSQAFPLLWLFHVKTITMGNFNIDCQKYTSDRHRIRYRRQKKTVLSKNSLIRRNSSFYQRKQTWILTKMPLDINIFRDVVKFFSI